MPPGEDVRSAVELDPAARLRVFVAQPEAELVPVVGVDADIAARLLRFG